MAAKIKDKKEEIDQGLLFLESMEKSFGKGSVMNLGSDSITPIDRVSTGSLLIDLALGGGVPLGRIIEIFGPESSGKTTLSHIIAANMQRLYPNKYIGIADSENAIDREYMAQLGIPPDKVHISQCEEMEKSFEITRSMIESGIHSVVIVDSIAACVPKSEMEGDVGDFKMGLQARLMSQVMRMINGSVNRTNTLLIIINQERSKIGVVYGDPNTTPGGRAVRFYASQRIRTKKNGDIKSGDDIIGINIGASVVKNKVAPPFKKASAPLIFGKGFDICREVLDLAIEFEFISKAGSWLSYKDTRLGQGYDKSLLLLEDNPELFEELKEKILVKIKS